MRTFSPDRSAALVVKRRRAPSMEVRKAARRRNNFREALRSYSDSVEQELNKEGNIAGRSGGNLIAVAVEALRKLLQDFNVRTNAKMSAIVSRSGVPVAWVLPDDAQVDNFATMAATLLGALEVMYTTMRTSAPSHVTVESDGGLLTVRGVTGKMFFVAMTDKRSATFGKSVDETISKAKAFLGEA
jgi:predicted regulator of Ras-like GTPase activity (Roadblock/LC7/MglB family)